MRRLTRFTLAACAIVGVTAGIAIAVPPTATTTPASAVTATTATLNGTVRPPADGGETTYFFEYGPTTAYGTKTTAEKFNGNTTKDVKADITGLSPSTTYNFRLVATNTTTNEVSTGENMTFNTPAAGANTNVLSIAASNRTVTFGRPTTISGTLSGPNRAGAVVRLEENPFPYTAGFKNTTLTATTDAAGKYSIVVSPTLNTRYRVSTGNGKDTTSSGEILVRVRVKVTLGISDRTPNAGQRVRFAGHVTPGHDGKIAKIQRRTATGKWRTITTTPLVAATPVGTTTRSKYSKRIRINKDGVYRVRVAPADGDHIAGNSRRKSVNVNG